MIVSGFSGNDMYCLNEKGFAPGSVVVGNSVQALGFFGGIASGLRTIAGGEIENLTQLITEGRHAAIERMEKEAKAAGCQGITGVRSELKEVSGYHEFLAIGSGVRTKGYDGDFFTTACSGQDFYCQIDAGYQPKHFVMGNVAYALGVGQSIFAWLTGVAGGEVKQYSDMYNHTRHLALTRLENEAKAVGANSVVDIATYILPFGPGVTEMLMVGTASYHPAFGNPERPVTSELTGEELWNLARLGYAPMRLLLGVSVYSLGLAGGIFAWFQSFSRGELESVTQVIYEARSNCLEHIIGEAKAIGADGVIDIKVFIDEISAGYVEVMAIGTAIKKMPGITTQSPALIPQAIIRDRDTLFRPVTAIV
ncbi:MAG: heavy metal-binding domain-containing protein [Planctomycetes bacterium]|nr:heavy metal-binding domain-containing protein [Planctomycetota bacterium]